MISKSVPAGKLKVTAPDLRTSFRGCPLTISTSVDSPTSIRPLPNLSTPPLVRCVRKESPSNRVVSLVSRSPDRSTVPRRMISPTGTDFARAAVTGKLSMKLINTAIRRGLRFVGRTSFIKLPCGEVLERTSYFWSNLYTGSKSPPEWAYSTRFFSILAFNIVAGPSSGRRART